MHRKPQSQGQSKLSILLKHTVTEICHQPVPFHPSTLSAWHLGKPQDPWLSPIDSAS